MPAAVPTLHATPAHFKRSPQVAEQHNQLADGWANAPEGPRFLRRSFFMLEGHDLFPEPSERLSETSRSLPEASAGIREPSKVRGEWYELLSRSKP